MASCLSIALLTLLNPHGLQMMHGLLCPAYVKSGYAWLEGLTGEAGRLASRPPSPQPQALMHSQLGVVLHSHTYLERSGQQ